MLDGLLDTTALRAARVALSGLGRRTEAISENVANIDTPGYQRQAVSFERALEASVLRQTDRVSMATTDPRHIASSGRTAENPNHLTPRDVIAERSDGNTVGIDEEMALLAETQIRYQALTSVLSRRLSTLRTVIRG